jgi:hypothetical protein
MSRMMVYYILVYTKKLSLLGQERDRELCAGVAYAHPFHEHARAQDLRAAR